MAKAELTRYVPPWAQPYDPADSPGPITSYDRTDVGLRRYRDGDWDHNPSELDEAADLIEQACGEPITLIEYRSDLTYWTARLRDATP